MSKYRNVSAVLLAGLALGRSAIAETGSKSSAPTQFEEPSYSQTCEEESKSMAEIYGCLADRQSAALEQRYQRVWQVLDAWQSDQIVKAFEQSQSAWLLAMYNYCDDVSELARPKYGLYAHDANNNCLAQHQEERSKALDAIYAAATDHDFTQWMGR